MTTVVRGRMIFAEVNRVREVRCKTAPISRRYSNLRNLKKSVTLRTANIWSREELFSHKLVSSLEAQERRIRNQKFWQKPEPSSWKPSLVKHSRREDFECINDSTLITRERRTDGEELYEKRFRQCSGSGFPVYRPPESGSICQRYGSSSFHHLLSSSKNSQKNIDS